MYRFRFGIFKRKMLSSMLSQAVKREISAHREAICLQRINLVGYMGVGKTVKGRRLATRFGMDFVDLDEYIVSQTGKSISRIFAEQGEDGFRIFGDWEKIGVADVKRRLKEIESYRPLLQETLDVFKKYLDMTEELAAETEVIETTSTRTTRQYKSLCFIFFLFNFLFYPLL